MSVYSVRESLRNLDNEGERSLYCDEKLRIQEKLQMLVYTVRKGLWILDSEGENLRSMMRSCVFKKLQMLVYSVRENLRILGNEGERSLYQ